MKKSNNKNVANNEPKPWQTMNQKSVQSVANNDLKPWQTLKTISIPTLNLNLIVPFKDKKGLKKNLLLTRLAKFEEDLHLRVELIREDVSERIRKHSGVGLIISARVSRGVTKYCWRRTTRGIKRNYLRLFDESLQDYLHSYYDKREFLVLVDAEDELIYINGNLKLIKTMQTALKTVDEAAAKLFQLEFHY